LLQSTITQKSGSEGRGMSLTSLVMALREREKWRETIAKLSQELKKVEREIEYTQTKLRSLEAELMRIKGMLQQQNSNFALFQFKIGQEVK